MYSQTSLYQIIVGEVYVESDSEWCQASLIDNFQLFKMASKMATAIYSRYRIVAKLVDFSSI